MGLLSGQALTYENIKIKAPYPIVRLLELDLIHQVNDHGRLQLTAVISDDDEQGYDKLMYEDEPVEVYEMDGSQVVACLFKGLITELTVKSVNGVYSMSLSAASHTILLDRQPMSRSYQEPGMTYYKLFRDRIDAYPHGDFIDLMDAERPLSAFTLQYQESDWLFLQRMASRLGTGLIPEVTSDAPRFWLGTSRGQVKGRLEGANYTIRRSTVAPGSRNKNQINTYYEVEDSARYAPGDMVIFKNQEWSIHRATGTIAKGILTFVYELVPGAGLFYEEIYHPTLCGTAINGIVIDRANESVRLHFNMDAEPPTGSTWFPYPTMYTANGVGWQCVAELGDTVQLYFPSANESEAYVIQALRKKGLTGDEIQQPERKLFHTRSGKKAKFDEKELALSSQKDKLLIRLNPATGMHVYSRYDMSFTADVDLVLHGKKVEVMATKGLNLSSKTSYLKADEEFHLKASKLLTAQVPPEELKAYESLMKELQGKKYPSWAQELLLKYKAEYYKAIAAGDQKGAKAAAAKAKQVREQLAAIDAMPDWARAQMHEYTAQWWEAHAAGDKARQNKIHALANKLRDHVLINDLIRGSTAMSYKDANRLAELSALYADAAHKLTVADKAALAKEAAELRKKYGIGNLQARENLNKLGRKFPDSFPYKLPLGDEWDADLNAALYDFAKKYGLAGKGYSREVLEVYLYQVANGILPWPKVTATKPVSKPVTEVPAKPDKAPDKPKEEEPADENEYKDGLVAVSHIEQYIKKYGLKGKQAKALYRVNDYTNNSMIKNKLSGNKNTPLVFFFEGNGSYSYAQQNHPEGRYGAMAIVVVNGQIKYTSKNASSLPDNESVAATVIDGVYEFVGGYHRSSYPALRVRDGAGVPATKGSKKTSYTATGINIHKGYNKDNIDRPTSTGCLTVHKDEYVNFLVAVGVVKRSLSEKPIGIKGLAIIDRKDR